jgi:hypothetical protein
MFPGLMNALSLSRSISPKKRSKMSAIVCSPGERAVPTFHLARGHGTPLGQPMYPAGLGGCPAPLQDSSPTKSSQDLIMCGPESYGDDPYVPVLDPLGKMETEEPRAEEVGLGTPRSLMPCCPPVAF